MTVSTVLKNSVCYNTAGSGDNELSLGSHKFTPKDQTEAVNFKVTRGDYAPLMQLLADNLAKAKVGDIFFHYSQK